MAKQYVFMKDWDGSKGSIDLKCLKYDSLVEDEEGFFKQTRKGKLIRRIGPNIVANLIRDGVISEVEDMTPKWEALIPLYIAVLKDPTTKPEANIGAEKEIMRCAEYTDKYNELSKTYTALQKLYTRDADNYAELTEYLSQEPRLKGKLTLGESSSKAAIRIIKNLLDGK